MPITFDSDAISHSVCSFGFGLGAQSSDPTPYVVMTRVLRSHDGDAARESAVGARAIEHVANRLSQ